MTLNMTYFADAMKEFYPDDVMKNLTYKNHAFLAMVPKKEDWEGHSFIVPVTYANPQGRSATFAQAVTNKGYSRVSRFVVTHVKDYSLASIDNLTIEASASSEGAFVDALKYEVDNALLSLGNSMAFSCFGNSGGALGQISATSDVSSTSITLKDIADVVKFEVGMVIKSDTTDGTTGTVNASSVTLTKIDRNTGTLTANGAWSTITGCAVNDYLFQDGDYSYKMSGLAGWIPSTAPDGSDSFFSLNRSYDPVRLAGVRVLAADVAGLPIEEKLLIGATKVAQIGGGSPDTIFVNHETFRDLAVSLHSKVMYVDVKKEDIDVFFQGITLIGPNGPLTVLPDRFCPKSVAYILTMDTWRLVSTGTAPHILDRDGRLLRESTTDSYEVRIGFYGNLTCNAPGWNGVVVL
jgi:hypothetical protein